MDSDLLKQYDNYFDLFTNEGWKQFIEDMEAIYEGYSIENIANEEALAYAKGERRILNQVLNFEQAIRTNYELTVEQNA